MQHSRPPNFPLFFPSFKKHRSSIDQSRYSPHLTLPKPNAVPVWASLPTPPMSGSPPPEQPSDPSQLAGRRRKRSDTPPTTTAPAAVSPPTPYEYRAQTTSGQARGGQPGGDASAGVLPYPSSYPPPPVSYGSGVSMGVLATTPPDALFGPGQVSPKAVRKTKAHVASACVNCKKKHLRCDNARPCRRCVQSGKEDSCRDVEHKKRGRPPLRPDEPSSRRSFDPASSMMPGQVPDPSRRMPTSDPSMFPQPAPYPRTFRPLQAQPSFEPARSQFRPGQPYQMYAPPTIQPSQATAMGSFAQPSRGYPGGQPMMSTQPPSPYMMSPSEMPRQGSSYQSSYSYPSPQGQMGMGSGQLYSNPIFPRSQLPHPEAGSSMMGASGLQLPPIRPASERSPIDPALMQPATRSQETSPQEHGSGMGTTRERDPKRPRMDIQGILGPKHD